MFELRLIIFFSLQLYFSYLIKAESQCGDWESFNKKCFKLFENNGLQTYEDAIKFCSQQSNDSSLVTITSEEEQRFLTTLIFITKEVVDNVWIGAKFSENQYKWLNGLNLTYTDWFEGHPKNLTDNCVQMHSDPDSMGKWVDEYCLRKNLVLCEKLPVWSERYCQDIVINILDKVSYLEKLELNHQLTISSLIQKEVLMNENFEKLKENEVIMNEKIEKLESTLQETLKIFSQNIAQLEKNDSTVENYKQNEVIMYEKIENIENTLQETLKQFSQNIEKLEKNESILKQNEIILIETVNTFKEKLFILEKNNVVPIGYIYVQYPQQQTPHEIWPSMTWQEITSSYAGLFFRAFGGNSSSFGSTQEANAPRITRVQTQYESYHSNNYSWESTINDSGWSNWVFTGGDSVSDVDIRFASSGGEVRPRNTAIRIWKRNA